MQEYSPLLWVLGPPALFILVGLVAWIAVRDTSHNSIDRAINNLYEQFARGEITEAEFKERRRLLETYPLMH